MVTHGAASLLTVAWQRGRETVSTGFQPLDRLLPAGGVRRGSLLEWLAADDATGAVAIACAVACRLAGSGASGGESHARTILVVDRGGRLYPPAVLPWLESAAGGFGRERPQLMVARPSTAEDEIWAIDQALRCPGVAAVLAWPGHVHATAMRRWQLAARAGGAVGLLVRGMGRGIGYGRRCERRCEPKHLEPTWAEARVAVQSVAPSSAADAALSGTAVRRLRLSLVGGPWAGDAMLAERATELVLDMASGCEAIGRRRAVGTPRQTRLLHREGLECRAS